MSLNDPDERVYPNTNVARDDPLNIYILALCTLYLVSFVPQFEVKKRIPWSLFATFNLQLFKTRSTPINGSTVSGSG